MDPAQSKATRTVLLADDEPSMLMVLSRKLMSWGYTVLTAANGEQAIKVAMEKRPDVILLDAMMPVLNGAEACRRLKSLEETRHIPIIFVTANVASKLCEEVMAFGALACVHKPLESGELKKRMEEALGSPNDARTATEQGA